MAAPALASSSSASSSSASALAFAAAAAAFPTHFPSLFDDDDGDECIAEPYTLRELDLIAFGAAVREKPEWWRKVFDEAIVAKWIAEALHPEQNRRGSLNQANLRYMIEELRCLASQRDRDGAIQLSCTDGVFQADNLVPVALKAQLVSCVARLENVPEAQRDYHPGSGKQVIDLVHPSLYCLRIGRSLQTAEPIPLGECLASFGAGAPQPRDPENPVFPPPLRPLPPSPPADPDAALMFRPYIYGSRKSSWRVPAHLAERARNWERKSEYFTSEHFAWMPAEFAVSDAGKVKIESYINNLHPVDHSELYSVIERITELFLPMWERVLTSLLSGSAHRIEAWNSAAWYEPQTAQDREDAERAARELAQRREARASAAAAAYERAEGGGDEDADEEELMDEDEYDEDPERTLYIPDIKHPFQPPPPQDLSDSSSGVPVSLRGRRLQIIVKLANIELTPENPFYKGGSWHCEGMSNERIVASGIYYWHSRNITESRLAFRQSTHSPGSSDEENVQAIRSIFGFEHEKLNQDLGSAVTKEDRMLAFPNTLQHRVQPFELQDKSQAGLRKILVLFLCDPSQRVVSTATVPPQQLSWFARSHSRIHRAFAESTPLIPDLVAIVLGYAQDELGVITEAQARADRELLMDERKFFVQRNTETVFERQYSLCEH